MIGHSGIGSPGRHLIHHPLETTQVGDLAANLGKVLDDERGLPRVKECPSTSLSRTRNSSRLKPSSRPRRTKVNRFRWSGPMMRYPPALRFGDDMTPIRS